MELLVLLDDSILYLSVINLFMTWNSLALAEPLFQISFIRGRTKIKSESQEGGRF